MNIIDYLRENNACSDGIEYLENKTDLRQVWQDCDNGSWMLWLARERNTDKKTMILAGVKCARLVEHLMKDQRSIDFLGVAEKYVKGETKKDELEKAAAAAYAASAAAYAAYAAADAAASASDAAADAYAAYAASAASAAAYAVSDDDAYAAAYAAAAFASADVRKQTLSKCADICRSLISFDDLKLNEVLK